MTEEVRRHYDRLSGLYRKLWGEHLHHGYFEGGRLENPRGAQIRLMEELAAFARIPEGCRVLDVGSGLGGSSLWLAESLGCSVLGVTLSPVQVRMAEREARRRRLAGQVRFVTMNASRMRLPEGSFDAVWIIECSEHLEDKEAFFRDCARVLRPQGTLGLCSWLRGDRLSPRARRRVNEVCRGMLCPSLATREQQLHWLRDAGFGSLRSRDLTRQVEGTWDLCLRLARRPEVRGVRALLRGTGEGRAVGRFLDSFASIREAYATGAMSYGMFTGRVTR